MFCRQQKNIFEAHVAAYETRKKIIDVLHRTGGGHYGGSLSVVDVLLVLYEKFLNVIARKHHNSPYNRLILSKGHAAIALYCVLAKVGLIDESKLYNYGSFMSGLEGHPDMLETDGIDFSTGSLGQGISVGLGMAMGLRKNSDSNNNHVWVVVGDGECQEGQIWEAALLATRYEVNNLHVIVDANDAQEYGYKYNMVLQQSPISNLRAKWESFGWEVQIVNGHNHAQLEDVFLHMISVKKVPSVVIAKTKKGYGVPLFEKNPEYYHCATLTDDEYQLVLDELNNYAK